MNSVNATKKGIIIGILMIISSVIIFWAKGNFENNLQYIAYFLYVIGILWTLISFRKNNTALINFKDYFSQGFKYFVVVTFLMVIFTITFLMLNPQIKEQMSILMRNEMVNSKKYTPAEIEKNVINAKKSFIPVLIMSTIFGYLLIGSIFTAIVAFILGRKNPTN